MMSTFGDDPTLSTSGLGGRLKISRGSIHAHVHGTVIEWEPRLWWYRLSLGSRGAVKGGCSAARAAGQSLAVAASVD